MSYSEALEILSTTVQKPAFAQALKNLREGREIALRIENRFDFAVFFKDGLVQVEERSAQGDVQFSLSSEAVRALSAHPADNMAAFGIAIMEQIAQGAASVRVTGSMWRVMTDGYLKIIVSAGPDFMSYLAKHGLSSMDKIVKVIRSLKS